jgi:uncharacterized protein (TIGR02996 family)
MAGKAASNASKKRDVSRREFLSVLFALPLLPGPVSASAAKGEALPSDDWMTRIIASPDDEALRLAYADWLTQKGNPLGEHIRLECELGRLDAAMPEYYTADTRRARLAYEGAKWFESRFAKWSDASTEQVSKKASKTVFSANLRRGMIEELTIDDAELFLAHWKEVFAAAPLIRCLTIEMIEDSEALQRLLTCPALANVRELSFQECELDQEALKAWAASEGCPELRLLEFSNGKLDAQGLTDLLQNGKFPQLTSLSLQGPEFSDEEDHADDSQLHAAIFGAPACPKLEHIEIWACSFLASAALGALNRRKGPLTSVSLDASHLGNDDVEAFLAVQRGALRSLRLSRGKHQGVKLRFESCQRLEELALEDMGLDDRALGDVAASAPQTVRKLLLKGGTMSAIERLTKDSQFRNLRFLDLGDNRIESASVEALVKSELLAQLVALRLGWNKIHARGARSIAGSDKSSNLRFLHLGDNPIGDEGVLALADSPHLQALNWLNIDNTGASEAAVQAVLDSKKLASLNALRADISNRSEDDNSDRVEDMEKRFADRFGTFDMIAKYGFYGRLI